MYVNTDVTYGKVEFASTIGNNSLVTVAESGSLSADNVNIYADDSDTTGWVNGIWVRGPGSVQVTEGTTIILDSTATSPAGQYQRIGVYLNGGATAGLGKESLVQIGTRIDGGFIYGAYLASGSTMTGGNLDMRLNNTADYTYGVYSYAGDNVVSFDSLHITLPDADESESGKVSIPTYGYGFYTDLDTNMTVDVEELNVNVSGSKAATGIYSRGGFTLQNNRTTVLTVTATGSANNAYGIDVYSDSERGVNMDFGTLEITADGVYGATGIRVENGTNQTITADSLVVTATGDTNDAYGVEIYDSWKMTVDGNANITADGGEDAKGVRLQRGAELLVGKGASRITTTGHTSYGIEVRDSKSTFSDYAEITAQWRGQVAETTRQDGQAIGVYVYSESRQTQSTATFSNGLKVTAIGGPDVNSAIRATGFDSNVEIINGLWAEAEDKAVWASGTSRSAMTEITINQDGGLTHIESDNLALWTYGNAAINVGGDAVQIEGDVFAGSTTAGSGAIVATFDSIDSWLTGKVSNKAEDSRKVADTLTEIVSITNDAGVANLTFSSGARWNLTDTSSLSTLSLDNGTVDMTQDGQGYSQLEIDDLNGSGIFRMDVDVDNEKNDLILVHGGIATPGPSNEVSSHVVEVASSGKASADASGVMIHSDAGVAVNFALRETSAGAKVDLGNYLYELVRNDNVVEGGYDWRLEKAGISPSAEAVAAMAGSGAQTAQYLDRLSDLYKRLGDVRQGVRDGLWASAQGRKDRISGFGGTGFKQDVYGFNIGYDRAVGSWILGGSFSASFADQKTYGTNFSATGDADSQGVSLYATYLGKSDQYADFVLTIDRYSQDIETRMLDGRDVKGDYSSFGFGLSAEVGKRFEFDGMGGIFVEPQAQLSWYRVNGKDFDLSNEMSVSQDDLNSLNGRVGVLVGRTFALSEESWAQVYVKGGVNHEFLDDQEIRINGERFEDDFLGTRGYYGFGVDWLVSRNTRFWAQVEREEGSDYTKEFEANVGMKYQF